jgi:ATP-dependent helicase/nuclease subunit B
MELIRRLTRLAAIPKQGEPTPPVGSRSERRIERARLAAPLLEKLSQMLTALPTTATPTEWSRALAKLSNALGLSRIIVDSPSEKAAWDRLMKSLRSMDRLTEWTQSNQHAPRAVADSKGTVPISQSDGTRSVPATLRELLDCIIEIAQCETLPPEHDEVGRVCIVGASSARPLSVPYVFFAGLTEKAFPAAEREDRVYSEAEIVRLAEAGLPLTTRAQRSQEEMLLFYEVATRATHQLVMSYAGLDAKAQPLSPSPYLVELERACGDGKIPHHVDLHLSPVPREQEILCERDLRVRAVADALDGNRKLLAGMVPQQGSGVRDQESGIQDQKARAKREHAASSLLTALHTIHDRSRGSEFGPFEGVFSSDAARAKLMERFGPDRCWSPSQLEKYAYCPFQFFSERIMRLEPLGDLALEVDYLLRGKLLHSTLTKVHRDLKDASGNLVSPSVQSAEAFETAARAVLGSILEMLCTDNLTAESLREVDRRVLAEWLSNYYTQHQDYDALWSEFESPLRPAHFEVAFGPLHEEADSEPEEVPVDCDILATSKPLELKQGDQTVRLRGRIDRVDLGQIAGRTVFNVIDYKSASDVKLSGETVAAGLTLQLPLYALAVEQLLLADREAIPWRASYWLVKEKGFRHRSALAFYQLVDGRLEPDDAWVNLRDQLLSRVVSLVRGVREGAFPMHCADDKCTGRCPYHTVCRVGQVRALEKTWQPPVAVV